LYDGVFSPPYINLGVLFYCIAISREYLFSSSQHFHSIQIGDDISCVRRAIHVDHTLKTDFYCSVEINFDSSSFTCPR